MKNCKTKLQFLLMFFFLLSFSLTIAQIPSDSTSGGKTGLSGMMTQMINHSSTKEDDSGRLKKNGRDNVDKFGIGNIPINLQIKGNIIFNAFRPQGFGIFYKTNFVNSRSWIYLYGNNPDGYNALQGLLAMGGKTFQIFVNSTDIRLGSPALHISADGTITLGDRINGPIREADIVNIDELKGYQHLRFDANGDSKHELTLTNTVFKTDIQKVVLDYGEDSDLAQISMNTDKQVDHAVLTVAGATYIGPKADLAAAGALSKFKPEYLDRYSLWVENGVVSEDFAFANVAAWKDEVLDAEYPLMNLEDLKKHIKQHKHLPGVPSEKVIKEKGYTAHQMNMIFMEKIEELTLHTISLHEKIKKLEEKLAEIENKK